MNFLKLFGVFGTMVSATDFSLTDMANVYQKRSGYSMPFVKRANIGDPMLRRFIALMDQFEAEQAARN
ncbi:Oidioi.mRNA.OKI2018_I69.chr2.g4545.t1.cds [Oikopleura dioica]|uniref:Oidioi.mRNA.OKI2018_I69.chr2.g4545.t1.cds n=1 Tax=Oikopleura dioica TaxID=34765 RepID=A0ABN7SXP0_OIKDI|nr:Oidioi.mRNA.OKI2018_I69.chr2.g4545.t1.cds [Oikopleura dioica]